MDSKLADKESETIDELVWTDGVLAAIFLCIGLIIGVFAFLKKGIE